MKQVSYWLIVLLLSSIVGCTNMSPTQQGAMSGGLIGAGAGAGIAALAGGNAGVGALVGGGLGAIGGGMYGNSQERRYRY